MNRKNTIIAAILINVGLLAVLLIAALSTQEQIPQQGLAKEESLSLPKFEEPPFYQELPLLTQEESPRLSDLTPVEPLAHKLPPIAEAPLAEPSLPKLDPLVASFHEVIVKKGESLEKIAKANRTTVDEIIKLNHLPSTFLKIGQVLKIPTEPSFAKPQEKKAIESRPEYYTIKVGENPWAIALRHQMKVDDLLKLNGLNEEKARKLKPGDRLRIR